MVLVLVTGKDQAALITGLQVKSSGRDVSWCRLIDQRVFVFVNKWYLRSEQRAESRDITMENCFKSSSSPPPLQCCY